MNPLVQAEIERRVLAMSEPEREKLSECLLALTRAFGEDADANVAIVVNTYDGELQIVPCNAASMAAINVVLSANQFLRVYDTMDVGARH